MTWKPAAWLAVAIVAAGIFIVVFDRDAVRRIPAPVEESPVVRIAPNQITRLEIQSPVYRAECVLKQGIWVLGGDRETRADDRCIRRILEAASVMRQREVITPSLQKKRGLTMASFGLDNPRMAVAFTGSGTQERVAFGADAPIGDGIYIVLQDSSDVVEASREVFDVVPATLDGLQDKAVFPPWIRRAQRIEIKQARGFVKVSFRGGEWKLQQPKEARAEGTKVENLLRAMEEARIQSFHAADTADEVLACGLGPEEAALQMTVAADGESETVTAIFGKPVPGHPNVMYGRVSDMKSIVTVPTGVVEALSVRADDMLDRRVCDADPALIASVRLQREERRISLDLGPEGWMLVEPVRHRADMKAVSALIRGLCGLERQGIPELSATNDLPPRSLSGSLKIALVGQTPPAADTNSPAPAARTWTFEVETNAVKGAVRAIREEDGWISQIPYRAVQPLLTREVAGESLDLTDARRYMDMQVVELAPASVRRLTLTADGKEQTVTRDAEGKWAADSPPGAVANTDQISALLSEISGLKATQIRAVAVTDPAAFGFGPKSPRLTIGVSGTAGIQKNLLIGRSDGSGGVFVMVQGQDVVFAIPGRIGETLARSFVTVPPP